MPRAQVNGTEIYYESHGEGPAVVFAHGRGGNHLSWWQQVPVFAEKFRCITFDHRGWGASVDEANGPGRDAFVEDLKQLLDHLEVERTYLVAQSMGGLTCLGFALAYPQRVLGLVLGDTTGGVGGPEVLEALKGVHPPASGLQRTLSLGFIKQRPELAFLYDEIRRLNPDNPNDGISASFRQSQGPQPADFAGWSIPTLLIVGKDDAIFPPEVIAEVQKVIPGSRMEVVPGAAHSAHFEQAGIFNKLVSELFAGARSETVAGAAAD